MTFEIKRLPANADKIACKVFLEDLWSSDKQYHIDDDPREIVYHSHEPHPSKGLRVFTDEEADILDANLERVREVMSWDEAWETYYKPTEGETT